MVEVWDDDDIFNDDYVEFLRDEIQFPNDPLTPFPFIVEGRTK